MNSTKTKFTYIVIFFVLVAFGSISVHARTTDRSQIKQVLGSMRQPTIQNKHTRLNKQARAQKQERYKMIQQLGEGISEMTRQLTQNMERLQKLENDKKLLQDRVIKLETKKIRKRLNEITNQLDDTVQAMERMQKRLIEES